MFEFYFIEEMQGSPAPGWFSKILPFITLLLGVALGRWFQFYDKRRRDKKATHDLVTEIQLLEAPLAKQVKLVDDLIANLKLRDYTTPKFTSIISLKLDRLVVVDRAGVVDYFERKLATREDAQEKANELFLGCDVFTHHHAQLQVVMLDHVQRSSVIYEDWRSKVNRLQRAVGSIMAAVEAAGNDPDRDDLVKGSIKLTENINQTENIFVILDEVHTPLTHLFAKHRTDPRAQELSELNSDALQAATALEREKGYVVVKLEAAKNSMLKQHEKFKTLLKKLKFVKH